MYNTFEKKFIEPLTKSEIKLIGDKGPMFKTDKETIRGVAYFERLHELATDERGNFKRNGIDFSSIFYYFPKKSSPHIVLLPSGFSFNERIRHHPSSFLRFLKFKLSNFDTTDEKELYHLSLKYLAAELASMLDEEYSFILPICHSKGFSIHLGTQLSKVLGINIEYEYVETLKNIKTQSTLNTSKRLSNLKKSLRLKKKFPLNSKILLIDDVITTGATIQEYLRLLVGQDVKTIINYKTEPIFEEHRIFNSNLKNSRLNFVGNINGNLVYCLDLPFFEAIETIEKDLKVLEFDNDMHFCNYQ
ncbi:hypothetical protein KO317_02355 [Candidatus Micrarchaeota archaeon]|nr:hypothetical protein [Candidatus Micrarchaeota archaeon]